MTVIEGAYDVIAHRVADQNPADLDGTLRETLTTNQIVCQECGDLRLPWVPQWEHDPLFVLRDHARRHADRTGHSVAVQSWTGTVYTRQKQEEASERHEF